MLRAFPGWATHESVKRDGAFALMVFHVGRRTENFAFDRRAPLLFPALGPAPASVDPMGPVA